MSLSQKYFKLCVYKQVNTITKISFAYIGDHIMRCDEITTDMPYCTKTVSDFLSIRSGIMKFFLKFWDDICTNVFESDEK